MKKTTLLLAGLLALPLVGCDRNTGSSETPADTAKTEPAKAAEVGSRRPDFSLPDMEGNMHHIDKWNGKVLVINFWATWCPPCRKETPAFVELQNEYGEQGLQFIGVAIDEPDPVEAFADTYGVNYPMLLGNLDAIQISKAYGNRFGTLPYTVIVDRGGKITYIQRGELLKSTAEKHIKALL